MRCFGNAGASKMFQDWNNDCEIFHFLLFNNCQANSFVYIYIHTHIHVYINLIQCIDPMTR